MAKPADFLIRVVSAAGMKDITSLIRDRLVSLRHYDAAGLDSDTITIELDDRDHAIAFPPTGAELEVYLGYKDALRYKGLFKVDEIGFENDPNRITISGKATDMRASLKAPKARSWDQLTFGQLAATIAAEHGYQAVMTPELANVALEHIDQNRESDLNLLSRLARERGAVLKPIDKRLLIKPKGTGRTASGIDLPLIRIDDPNLTKVRGRIAERHDYQTVVAYWFDERTQEKVTVQAGSGEPAYALRNTHQSQDAAERAASAKLADLKRGKVALTITAPGMPDAVAESPVEVANHRDGINGSYLAESVENVIRDGEFYSTTFEVTTKEN